MSTLIIFDIDGTLTDTVEIHQKAFVNALNSLGVHQINSNLNSFVHHTDSYIAKTIFEDALKTEFTKQHLTEFEVLLHAGIQNSSIHEIPGASELLNYCSNQNELFFSYATGSLHMPALLKLESISASVNNFNLHCSNEMHSREEIVSGAIEAMKTEHQIDSFDRIISIGDGKWDYKTAENLGLEFVGVGTAPFRSFGSYPVNFQLNNWKDLKSFSEYLFN